MNHPLPWTHQPYGGQNQNGDYSGGCIFDARGEYVVSEVDDEAGALIVSAVNLYEHRPYDEAMDHQYGAWESDDIEEAAHDMLAVVAHRRGHHSTEL